MLSTLEAVLIGVPLTALLILSIAGALLAAAPAAGALVLALLAVCARAGLRGWRDRGRSALVRRLALASALLCASTGLAALPFAAIESAYGRFTRWHAAGAGLKPGMTLDEARGVLARKAAVTDFAVDPPRKARGARFQVEPTGLAACKFEFPLAELYYLDVSVDEKGRVVKIEPWND